MIIGEITSVYGIRVKGRFYEKLPPYMVKNSNVFLGPKINSYVKTNVGLVSVVCQITGEEVSVNDKNQKILELNVIGSIEKGLFSQGLRYLPLVGAKIRLFTEDDYKSLFVSNDSMNLNIGNDLFEPTRKISIDLNSVIPTHIGIFGNTGSGKSNTLTKILQEYLNIIEDKRINSKIAQTLLFDLNNEYGDNAITNLQNKEVIKLTTQTQSKKRIPIDYSKLSEDQLGVLLNATKKTQMPIIKRALRNMKGEFDSEQKINSIRWAIINCQKNAIYTIRNELYKYIMGLEDFQFISGRSNSFIDKSNTTVDFDNKKHFDFINDIEHQSLEKIKVIEPKTWLERFEFELIYSVFQYATHGNNLEFVKPLITRLKNRIKDFNKIFNESENEITSLSQKNIVVIQLGQVNQEIRELVPSIISDLIFDSMRKNDRSKGIKQIRNIVIDEAHNILKPSKESNDIASNSVEVFEKIIKEGRKYGVFLIISSQRPSDISETITSQLHNYFIHKLVNKNDIKHIEKTVSFMDKRQIDMLSVLGPGECIISGTGFIFPMFAKIKIVDEVNEPLSRNVKLLGDEGIFSNKESKKIENKAFDPF
ncbi:ATP-binding protein [Haloplasma contractile]|uniref:Bipolar DNA helicase protein n=1 Tax=Haloplasma contractile SSD-17B TaxID=1033810 RepID=F7PTW6_9MOLU|nr:ATP-binding protein [Haloplasma contractile]ERJ12284.1 Bipolar DNA helicase protein [Haloplasma contractile SSD-17B]